MKDCPVASLSATTRQAGHLSSLHYPLAENNRLKQGVRCQPVSSMHSGAGSLASSKQPTDVCLPPAIDLHPSHNVMGGRGDGNESLRDIQAVLTAEAVYVGKPGGNQPGRQMSNIQKNSIGVSLLHLVDNAASHNISGCQLGLVSIIRHETTTFYISEYATLSSDCFRDEKRSHSGQAQNGGMKLEELHVAYLGTGVKSRCYPITCDHIGVSGIFEQSANPTSSQDEKSAMILFRRAGVTVESLHSGHPVLLYQNSASQTVFKNSDRIRAHLATQCDLNMLPGGISTGMHNAGRTMSRLPGQRDFTI